MVENPTYEELEKKVAELEQQIDQHNTAGLQNPPELLSALMDAFRYIPLCKTFEEAAKEIFHQCKRLTGAQSGYVTLLSENGKENEELFVDTGGLPCDVDTNLQMPIKGLRETAYKTKDVVYNNTFQKSSWIELMPEGHVRLDNVLFAPLNIENKTVGIIGIANKPGGFNEQDAHVSKIMGDLAAVALTYATSQDRLKNSEELFRTLFEQSAVGIAQVNPDGSFIRVNTKFTDIIGYSKDELARLSFDEITYPDDLNKEKKIIDRIIKAEIDAFEIEKRYIHKSGDLVWIKLYSNVVRDEKNNIQYAIASVIDITKRKNAETALQQSEEKYRKLYDEAPVGYFEYDLQGNITRVNRTEVQMLGYTAEEMIGQPCWKFIVDEVAREQILAKLGGVRPPAVGLERTYRRKDGTTFPVLFEDRLLFDEDGHISGIRTAIQDITVRKHAEKTLREKTKLLQNIIDTTSDLIAITDLEGNFKFIGPSHRFLGYDPDSLVGTNVMELVHPDDYQEAATAFAEFLANREDGRKVEYRCRSADGDYLWFETVGKFIFDDTGNPKEILFSSRDFTARKRAEESLKENEQKFRTIFNSNMDSISLLGIDPDGKPSGFIDCNDAACEIFGYSKEELKLKKLEDLEIQVPENVMIQRLESLQTKGSVDFETVIKDKNGNDRYVEVKAVLMNLPNQPAIMNISRDITERKQAEAKILYLQKTESLGRMAGAIAHHFNNQLSVVMGNLELVLDDLPNDSENRENLSQAFEAASKAADQSRQMLRYLGHVSGNQTTIDMSRTCRQTLPLLQSTVTTDVTLNVNFPDSGPFIHADAGQIQQVLTNLFTNARESISDNQGSINLSIQTVSHENISKSNRFPLDWHPKAISYACLEISDTGPGISNENILKIFDPFYTTKFTGRGMGLSVTMGILKTHNGCITVESEPESGCFFRVYLPVTTEKTRSI